MVRPKKKISSSFCPSPQSKFNLRPCSVRNCPDLGIYKAPKSRTDLTSYLWFCLEHIQEYNKKWNYYKNLSPEEVAWEDDADRTWRRPSHSFRHTHLNRFFLYGHNSPFAATASSPFSEPSPSLPHHIISALQLFHLTYPYSQDELKGRIVHWRNVITQILIKADATIPMIFVKLSKDMKFYSPSCTTIVPRKGNLMTLPLPPSKTSTWRIYFTKRLVIIGLFGFSSGLPLLLTMSTLTWWLAKAGLTKQTIGIFSLATIPYAYKFLWAPFVDRLPLPFLTRKMGRRRSWLLFSQIILAASIALMGTVNPIESPALLFIFALLVAFWSATQDIVIDSYRIQSLNKPEYAAGAAMEVNGYRLGMMVAGAGALALSDDFSWAAVYGIMALMLGIGIITTFFCPEPNTVGDEIKPIKGSYGKWLLQTYWGPFKNFMQKPGWILILIFILIYKMGDNLLGNMATVFYKELGFTGAEVGTATKFFGSWMTILGSFLIGFISYRMGIMKSLFFAGILHLLTNGMFIIMDHVGHNVPLLYGAIALENTSNGMMIGSFVAYLSSLCSVEYTATQYALLSSMMAQCRTVVQALSGWVASLTTWTEFFIWAMVAALPGLLLLLYLMKKYPLEQEILPRKVRKKPAPSSPTKNKKIH